MTNTYSTTFYNKNISISADWKDWDCFVFARENEQPISGFHEKVKEFRGSPFFAMSYVLEYLSKEYSFPVNDDGSSDEAAIALKHMKEEIQ